MSFHRNLVGADLHEPSKFQGFNDTGLTITSLKVVKDIAYNAPFVEITPITSTTDRPAGVVKDDIPDMDTGLFANVGILDGVDTSSFIVGAKLFADASGDLTNVDTGLFIGTVLISDATNGVIFINIAAQGSQGVPGAAATAGVVLVTPIAATAQASIGAALAAAVSGDAVVVGPGIYAESVIIPSGVTLIAPYGREVTAITGALATGTRVTLNNTCLFSGFTVNLPTDASPAVEYTGALTANVAELGLLGLGGLGTGIRNNGVGTFIINTVRYTGNCDIVFESLGGGDVIIANTGLRAGTVTDVAIIKNSSSLTINDSGVFSTLTGTDGIQIDDGTLQLNSTNIEGVDNAIHVTSNNHDIRLQGSSIIGAVLDFLVDPVVTTGVFSANAARFSSEKFVAPLVYLQNADIGALFFDTESSDDNTVRIIDELSVGTSIIPGKLNVGEGDSYTRGAIALTNTNLDIGVFADITSLIVDPGGSSTSIFPANSANNTFFVGGDIPFFGVRMDTQVAIILGTGSLAWEFWNGASWEEFEVMATQVLSPLDQFADTVFQRVQDENISFSEFINWTQLTLNGELKFWVRVRIVSAITTVPQVDILKLIPNRLRVGPSGELSLFGDARPVRSLPWDLTFLVDIAGASPANQNVNVSANIVLALTENRFNNGTVDSRGGIIQVPFGLDTSVPLALTIDWFQLAAGVGNVELEVDLSLITIGDILDGTLPEIRFSQVVAVPNVVEQTVRTQYSIPIPQVIPGDLIALRIFRDATGGNPEDNYSGEVILFGTFLVGKFWK